MLLNLPNQQPTSKLSKHFSESCAHKLNTRWRHNSMYTTTCMTTGSLTLFYNVAVERFVTKMYTYVPFIYFLKVFDSV